MKRSAEAADLDDDEAPRNETGKALFVRDSAGELITVCFSDVACDHVPASDIGDVGDNHDACGSSAPR